MECEEEFISQPRELNTESHIRILGPHNTICSCGFTFNEAKSILQKSIRRGMYYEAICILYEMFEVGKEKDALLTNLISRIMICAFEDIDIANPHLIDKLLNYLIHCPIFEFDELASYVYYLCVTPKTRISDQAYHIYGDNLIREKHYNTIIDNGIQLIDDVEGVLPCIEVEEDFIDIIGKIEYLLLNCDYNAMKFIWQLGPANKKSKGVKCDRHLTLYETRFFPKPLKKKRADVYVWRLLKILMFKKGLIIDLYELDNYVYWYYKTPEPIVVLNYIVSLYIKNRPLNLAHFNIEPDDSILEYIKNTVENPYTISVPKCFFDMHTYRGKKAGMNRKDFVKDGSKITIIDEEVTDPVLERLFMLE